MKRTKYPGGRTQAQRTQATGMTQEQRRQKHYATMDAYKRTKQTPRSVHRSMDGRIK